MYWMVWWKQKSHQRKQMSKYIANDYRSTTAETI